MAPYNRPGHPHHLVGATEVSTAECWHLLGETTQFVIHNLSTTVALEVFFTVEAKDRGSGYGLTIPPQMGYEGVVQIDRFWTLSAAAVPFEVVAAVIP